ncbi:hypothetical protein MMC30_006156 [Trapelia coarctata]|nr:hypothetical protein [Trapelia coarctata]
MFFVPFSGLFSIRPRFVAADCSIAPRSLPLKNNTLADGVALNRGIPVQLGGQSEGFRVTFTKQNTLVRNGQDCILKGNVTNVSGCWGASGGVFDVDSSFKQAPDGTWNGTSEAPPIGATVLQGYDDAIFPGGLHIPGFPFEVWSEANALNKSSIGLGPNSSVLRSFVDAKAVPSTAMGLFFGSRSQDQAADGELIVGGYNSARVGGSFTNFTIGAEYLDIPCPLQVLLKDVQLNNANGSHSLFADSAATVAACIDPLQNGFSFTQVMFERFASLTQLPASSSINASDSQAQNIIYPSWASEPLIGNLTITLSNGYQTVIPHHELVSQQRGTDSEGKYGIVDPTKLSVAINIGQTDFGVQIPLLGGLFLSQNFLLVDYARNTFGLAPAVTGNANTPASNIVPICSEDSTSGNSNTGPIVGGVIGGLALLILCAAALFWRRRQQKKRSRSAEGHQPDPTVPMENTDDVPPVQQRHPSEVRGSDASYHLDSKMLSPTTQEMHSPVERQELEDSSPGGLRRGPSFGGLAWGGRNSDYVTSPTV